MQKHIGKPWKKCVAALVLFGIFFSGISSDRAYAVFYEGTLDDVPYYSSTQREESLMQNAMKDINGDDKTYTRGAEDLYQEASQIASTIENDVMSIIKDRHPSSPPASDRINELLIKIYDESYTIDDSEPCVPEEGFGLLNSIECQYHNWNFDLVTDAEGNIVFGDRLDVLVPGRADKALSYYHAEAKLEDKLTTLIDMLKNEIQNYQTSSMGQQDLLTVAVDVNGSEITGTDGPDILPEYTVASRDLHDLVTNERSLITGKDYTYWGNSTRPVTLEEITNDFRLLTYVRTRAINQKYQERVDSQLDLANKIRGEINDITGFVSASPYDMESTNQSMAEKILRFLALSSPLDKPVSATGQEDNGFDGKLGPDILDLIAYLNAPTIQVSPGSSYPSIEPVGSPSYQDIITQLFVIVADAPPPAYNDSISQVAQYKTQYEDTPNLTNPVTHDAFQEATYAVNNLKVVTVRALDALIRDLSSRSEQAATKVRSLDEIISSAISSLSASSSMWSEMKAALVKIVSWLLSLFGRLLNFGLSELNATESLRQIHRITLGFANIGFIVLIAFTGLAISMEWNVSSYNIKRILPRYIAAIILVNASLPIAQFFTDLSLIVTNVFLTSASQASLAVANGLPGIELFARSGISGNTLGLSSGAPNLLFGSLLSSNYANTSNSLFTNDLVSIFTLLIVFATTVAVDVLLVIRSAGLWLLVITAPLVFMMWLLPTTQGLFNTWWKNFFRLVVLGPLVAIIFLIGISLARIGLTDDFLRVFIGIGTFALMLAIPSFMSMLSLSLPARAPKPKFPQRSPGPQNFPSRNETNPHTPSSAAGDLNQQMRNAPPVPKITPGTEKQILEKITTQSTSVLQHNSPLPGSPPSKEHLEVADIIKNNQSGSRKTSSSPVAAIVEKLLKANRFDTLTDRLASMFNKHSLSNNITSSLFRVENGIKYLASMLTGGDNENVMAHTIIREHYHEVPTEIGHLTAIVQNSDEHVSNAALQVLKIGIETLGTDLLQNPTDPHLREAAKEVVTKVPDKLVSLISGTDPLRPQREVTVEAGMAQVSDPARISSALVTSLSDEDLKELGPSLAIPGLGRISHDQPDLISPSHIEKITDGIQNHQPGYLSIAADMIKQINDHPDQIGGTGQISLATVQKIIEKEKIFQSFDKTLTISDTARETIEKTREKTLSSVEKETAKPTATDTPVARPAMTMSPTELFKAVSGDLKSLTPERISALFSLSDSQLSEYSSTLKDLANISNQIASGKTSAETLATGSLEALQAQKDRLNQLGFPVMSGGFSDADILAAHTLLKGKSPPELRQIPDPEFLKSYVTLAQSQPDTITSAQTDRLMQGLASDPKSFLPAVYLTLSPTFEIPSSTIASLLDSLAQTAPGSILPEHVLRAIQGLGSDPEAFRPAVNAMALNFAENQADVDIDASLTPEAAAILSAHHQDLMDAIPSINLTPNPTTNQQIAEALVAQSRSEAIDAIPDQVFFPGMNNLARNKPYLLEPEHVTRVLDELDDHAELAKPIVSQLAADFNHSNIAETGQPLSRDNMYLLASQAESLQGQGFSLDESKLSAVFSDALSHGVDLKDMQTLDLGLKEIARRIAKPPGAGEGASQAIKATIDVSDLTKKDEGQPTESAASFVREDVSDEQLSIGQSSDDLSAYAGNVKNDKNSNILAPEIQTDLSLINPTKSQPASQASSPDEVVIDSSKTSQSNT